MPRLSVLHCIPSLGCGGAEFQLAYLAEGLANSGVEVHIAYRADGMARKRLQNPMVKLHRLRVGSSYSPALFLELLGLFRRLRPDVVQTWLPQMDILAGAAAIATGTPFILSERSAALSYPGGWKDKMRSKIGKRALLVVANSRSGGEYWHPRRNSSDVRIIPNGLPLSEIYSVPPMAIDSERKLVLFAGRFSSEKNVLKVIEALDLVFQENSDVHAVLFGGGTLHAQVAERVRTLNLENRVRLLGQTDKLWSWMKSANLLVSVSFVEGSPNVILEAAAAKCPLVLSEIDAHRELFDESSASFVSPSSPPEIARAILKVLRDPGLAAKKAEVASLRISSRSIESVVSEYLQVYQQALAG